MYQWVSSKWPYYLVVRPGLWYCNPMVALEFSLSRNTSGFRFCLIDIIGTEKLRDNKPRIPVPKRAGERLNKFP